MRGTLEALPQLAFTTDADGSIENVNKQWLDFALSGKNFPETPADTISLGKQWQQLIKSNAPVETEVAIKKLSDGVYYYHLLRATPVIVNGHATRWVGTLTSIHEQKTQNEILEGKVAERTKELMEVNHNLKISNNDLQQFTSVASHDLKEPLRKIQFFGDLLKAKAELSDEMTVHLEKIIRSSRRMSTLIEDLLSFASLSKPNLFQLTDINEIINDIISDFEISIEEKNAVITVHPIPKIEVIPSLIRQLFQNIISNALKFSQPGVSPQITIRGVTTDQPLAEEVEVPGGLYCRITISDNGIGFEEKYADKIFTIFQRLNGRTEYEGTGIGLAIARKIVDRHNGWIRAKSQPGEGSDFTIVLPVIQNGPNKLEGEELIARNGI